MDDHVLPSPPEDSSSSSSSSSGCSSSSSAAMTSSRPAEAVVPSMVVELDELLRDMAVKQFEPAVIHMLLDLLQREVLSLLSNTAEVAEYRQMPSSSSSSRLYLSVADAQLCLLEYLHVSSVQPQAADVVGEASMESAKLGEAVQDQQFDLEKLLSGSAEVNSLSLCPPPRQAAVWPEADRSSSLHRTSLIHDFTADAAEGRFPLTVGPDLPEDFGANCLQGNVDVEIS
eukprot:GHVS01021190.1.p1 GENE.GHVS01021190.1~~GHVS01021190.1.p1  ORF type:complete len:229 (+),score=71.07 GHVS01021190.1:41-727(+)